MRDLDEAEQICQQGTAAGFDMTAQQTACVYYRDWLQKIIDNLGPKRGKE